MPMQGQTPKEIHSLCLVSKAAPRQQVKIEIHGFCNNQVFSRYSLHQTRQVARQAQLRHGAVGPNGATAVPLVGDPGHGSGTGCAFQAQTTSEAKT